MENECFSSSKLKKKSYRNFHFVFYFVVEETFEDVLQNRAEKDEKEETISVSEEKKKKGTLNNTENVFHSYTHNEIE